MAIATRSGGAAAVGSDSATTGSGTSSRASSCAWSPASDAATPPRRSAKNARSTAEHSSASTPAVTGKAWFSRESSCRRSTEPSAPALASAAPKTHRPTRAFTIRPAHMGHGSSVTYTVQSERRHRPSSCAAATRAENSACADGSPSSSRRLHARAITRPARTTTAPTGTSPSDAARLASDSASRMNRTSASRISCCLSCCTGPLSRMLAWDREQTPTRGARPALGKNMAERRGFEPRRRSRA